MTDLLKVTDDLEVAFTSIIKRNTLPELMEQTIPDLCGIVMTEL